jgi:hypothetical protein
MERKGKTRDFTAYLIPPGRRRDAWGRARHHPPLRARATDSGEDIASAGTRIHLRPRHVQRFLKRRGCEMEKRKPPSEFRRLSRSFVTQESIAGAGGTKSNIEMLRQGGRHFCLRERRGRHPWVWDDMERLSFRRRRRWLGGRPLANCLEKRKGMG